MANITNITVNRYIPFACIYFFCNSLFLPEGLLYTTFITPLFFYQIIKDKRVNSLIAFIAVITLFLAVHFMQGINEVFYVRSYILFITVGVFCIWFTGFCAKVSSLEKIFNWILYINALLIPFALLSLKFDLLKEYFWYLAPITSGIPVFPRLKMFTYEASYYSLLFVPIVFFVVWNFLLFRRNINTINLILILVLLGLSFSLGVIAGIVISLLLCVLFNMGSLLANKRVVIITVIGSLVLLATLIILFKYFPENPLVIRIKGIPTGSDTSARGRTYEAFDLAYRIAIQKSLWFGVGLGQIKEIGRTIIIQYYYYTDMPEVVRVPNAMAEMFAMYGTIGVSIKLLVTLFCFFATKVYKNYYRLSLFLFIFIYQFTGSFLFNIAEYVIWILAFSPVLPQFIRRSGIVDGNVTQVKG
jgi:hypothetical protein